MIPAVSPHSVLLITLDSCRYDTFAEADAPCLKSLGTLHRAMAPSYFTYASHAAMFVGFTPGITEQHEPWINPKVSKIFKIAGVGFSAKASDRFQLAGKNIIDGFKRKGYLTLGTGAVNWFNPETETGKLLSGDFDLFYYPGKTWALGMQLAWFRQQLDDAAGRPVFAFLNIGETHLPYYYEGAPWHSSNSPCVPFSNKNNAVECRRRQRACLEFVDRMLKPLLNAFSGASTIVCADHGDCWGEDGLWEHGFHHQKVLEVPLILRLT